ncbi:MAG: hypothetical protein JWR80_6832 [Bradyrhizobium sp.]|nr:hypothetical protein [Bradyrhizobium sp.]
MNQSIVVLRSPPGCGDDADFHLKRVNEERARALAATSPGIAAPHFELSRLHAAAIGRSGFVAGLFARAIDETPD